MLTTWFIKDTAKSSRVRYLLDSAFKYAIVKPSMAISIGLTDDYEIRIKKIGFETGNIGVPKVLIDQMIIALNNDRINFMGEID